MNSDGLGWIQMDLDRLGWIGMDWDGFGWIQMDSDELGWIGVDWDGFGWIGMDRDGILLPEIILSIPALWQLSTFPTLNSSIYDIGCEPEPRI